MSADARSCGTSAWIWFAEPLAARLERGASSSSVTSLPSKRPLLSRAVLCFCLVVIRSCSVSRAEIFVRLSLHQPLFFCVSQRACSVLARFLPGGCSAAPRSFSFEAGVRLCNRAPIRPRCSFVFATCIDIFGKGTFMQQRRQEQNPGDHVPYWHFYVS